MSAGADYGHYDSLSHSRNKIELCQFTFRFTDFKQIQISYW